MRKLCLSIKNSLLVICVVCFNILYVILVLSNSTFSDVVAFQYVLNQRTGELLALVPSLFLYLLFGGFVSGLVGCTIAVVSSFVDLLFNFNERIDKKNDQSLTPMFLIWGSAIPTFFLILLGILGIIHPNFL